MIFALLTLLTSLALATVAGWFSIVGFMAIYAAAPIPALIMGATIESAKLVTISWIYRNWQYINWKLKVPLIYFIVALMVATSIGVFGFLSKGHLEQGSGTIDNSSKIETLNYQIQREKNQIADNEKLIGQLDATVNSFLGKDRTDRSLSVRRSQAPQRKQLREDSAAIQQRIDTLSEEKFKLESEIRNLELEVGPIRYIAELFYGVEENATKNIEAAVRIFTLLLVSTLDPLAVILLIAANHTLLRLNDEKEKKTSPGEHSGNNSTSEPTDYREESSKTYGADKERPVSNGPSENQPYIRRPVRGGETEEKKVSCPVLQETVEEINEEKKITPDESKGFPEILYPVAAQEGKTEDNEEPTDIIREILKGTSAPAVQEHEETVSAVDIEDLKSALAKFADKSKNSLSVVRQPQPSRVVFHEEAAPAAPVKDSEPIVYRDAVIRELLGNESHFIPKKVKENSPELEISEGLLTPPRSLDKALRTETDNKYSYPKALSWLTEFKRI